MPAPLTAPRRLLLTADAVGGVWTYALDLARGLVPYGTRVTLAVLGPAPTPAQRAAAARIPGLALVETGLPLDWVTDDPDDVERAGVALGRLARAHDVDLVQVNSAPLAATGDFGAPLVVACHSCVATWWHTVRGDAPAPDVVRWRTAYAAAALARADLAIAPTHAFAAATQRTYGLPQAPVVVHNGRSIALGPLATGALPRAVFTAGRLWDDAKNVATLDRVAARLAEPVVAAGPLAGPQGHPVRFERLHCTGALCADDVALRLARRPVFVSLARYEPFGLAVLEAAQAGCPLVLADIPTFRELWDGAALFVSPDDDTAAAAALQALLADEGLRRHLGTRARARARRYTLAGMVRGTLAAWAARTPEPVA